MNKDDIRRKVKASKALLSAQEKAEAAVAVFAALEKTPAFMMADKILLYHSLPDELSTLEFIDKWHATKHFFLPRVNGVNLDVLPYDRSTLRYGAFHIEEPQAGEIEPAAAIELVVVPAVAFDRAGNRVGRGKGYYDRLLADVRATKIGVGYDFQLVESIEAEPHDVRLDMIITPTHVIKITTGHR